MPGIYDNVIAFEVNFDGLVGPTHHYGGLAAGNLASQGNRFTGSNPRAAALQGLAKMKLLMDRGLKQAILPPHPRPLFEVLRESGFQGTDRELIGQAAVTRPDLLSIAYSSASMWAANSATVSPSADTADRRVHITPANLIATKHRRLESDYTEKILKSIFRDRRSFVVHSPLPRHRLLADEGAANQLRMTTEHGRPGFEIFVYGRDAENGTAPSPRRFMARQTRQASEFVANQHRLSPTRQHYLHQNPMAIDAGVFHNDVISVSNEDLLLCHEFSFVNQRVGLQRLRAQLQSEQIIEISNSDFSLSDAVKTYLFNSQIVTLPRTSEDPGAAKEMLMICPSECQTHPRAQAVIQRLLDGPNYIKEVEYVDVGESLKNGGGPACLRLRVVLTELELSRLHGNILLTPELYEQLCDWVRRHYRESLSVHDLADETLLDEVQMALSELDGLLGLELTSEVPQESLPKFD